MEGVLAYADNQLGMQKKTVFVGLSGGVDSGVAAAKLQTAGYEVVGVFIKVWHPDFLVCNWEQERLDAMRVAATLDIPFLTCDAESAYRDAVAAHFINEYQAGRTPNPDVLCNQHVKFGAFLDFARAHGADFIATGHYARRLETAHGPALYRGVDQTKDQSYFLWSLTTEQLARSLFPLGESTKQTVRAEAAALGLPTATKPDSQGICFLGHIDIPEFLAHYVTLEPGPVLDETGQAIGTHQGAITYTLGQRHGFTITTHDSNRPVLYVTAIDVTANTITVGPARPTLARADTVTVRDLVLRSHLSPSTTVSAQFRYRQAPFPVTVSARTKDSLTLTLADAVERPAAGQSCVLYDGDHCLGGGIIG
ncbi:MAG: tRNA 2-thiouridine(34) synthase MnmA [Patescibacteria group bacterium]